MAATRVARSLAALLFQAARTMGGASDTHRLLTSIDGFRNEFQSILRIVL
jgi:hypothetical protein